MFGFCVVVVVASVETVSVVEFFTLSADDVDMIKRNTAKVMRRGISLKFIVEVMV